MRTTYLSQANDLSERVSAVAKQKHDSGKKKQDKRTKAKREAAKGKKRSGGSGDRKR